MHISRNRLAEFLQLEPTSSKRALKKKVKKESMPICEHIFHPSMQIGLPLFNCCNHDRADTTFRWLAIRLEFIGSIIILAAASFACISVVFGSGLSAGWVGLAMAYALQVRSFTNP